MFFLGCSSGGVKPKPVDGLSEIPQNPHIYSKNIKKFSGLGSLQEYKKNYYRVWHQNGLSIGLEDAQWADNVFKVKNSYGENFQPLEQNFFNTLHEEENFQNFSTINKKAITLHRLNIRALPTRRALFHNPKHAGEGYPFDYLQNSSIAAFKPVLVSHYSKSKEWVFIEASFAYGWVKAKDIAFIDDRYAKEWEDAKQMIIIKDKQAVYNKRGKFLFRTQIGMLLPDTHYFVIDKDAYSTDILAFNSENIDKIINELYKNIYGWGGMYGQRDCSATMRDFFAPFGLWLPRNSSKQAKVGKVFSLESLSDKEKLLFIKQHAIPFQTLLYKAGHIVLYVGTYNDKVVIFHNTWGIKTKSFFGDEGRYIIGHPIFSTLDFGKNIKGYNTKSSILHHLKSMNIVSFY